MFNVFEQCLVHAHPPLDSIGLADLGCDVRHVGFEVEPGQVGDVIEGHLLYVHDEAALARHAAERALAVALQLADLDLPAVALLLIEVPLMQGDRVRVLVAVVLRQFVGVEADPLAELGEVTGLERGQGGASQAMGGRSLRHEGESFLKHFEFFFNN